MANKIYTEEQIRIAIAMGYDWCHQKHIPNDDMIDTFINQLTPIEFSEGAMQLVRTLLPMAQTHH